MREFGEPINTGFGHSQYRLHGEIETLYGKQPLPPTPITNEAVDRLRSWGMPDEAISGLCELSASMRYDCVPERVERMVQGGGFIHKGNDEVVEEVVLPAFKNVTDRLDGACGELAAQLLYQQCETGWREDVDAGTTEAGKPKIDSVYVNGFAREFFLKTEKDDNKGSHMWTGLVPEGTPSEMMVVVDPSLQEISTLDQSGYAVGEIITELGEVSPAIEFPLNSWEITSVRAYLNEDNGGHKSTILGRSSDGGAIYSMNFIRNGASDTVVPIINAHLPTPPDSGTPYPQCIENAEGEIVFFGEAQNLTEEQRAEMMTIYRRLREIPFSEDQGAAVQAKNSKIVFDFGESNSH